MPKVVTECSPAMDFLQAYFLFIHDNSSQSKAKHKNQLGFQASSAEAIRVLCEIPTAEKCRHLDVQRVVSKIHSQNIFTMPVNIPSSIINYGFISKTLLIQPKLPQYKLPEFISLHSLKHCFQDCTGSCSQFYISGFLRKPPDDFTNLVVPRISSPPFVPDNRRNVCKAHIEQWF